MNASPTPENLGAFQSVANSTALAALDVNLTEGTKCYNAAVDADFTLKVSTASLVTDQIVAVAGNDGLRWVLDSVTNAQLAPMAAHTIKSNLTGSTAAPADNTVDAVADALATSTHPLSQTYVSGIVDLTTTDVGGITVMLPAKPGFFPLSITQRAIIVSKAGTLSTQPTFSMGADAGFVDYMASTAVSFAAGFAGGVGSSVAFATVTAPVATNSHTTPVYFKQTVAAAGSGLALTVRFILSIVWVPTIP